MKVYLQDKSYKSYKRKCFPAAVHTIKLLFTQINIAIYLHAKEKIN